MKKNVLRIYLLLLCLLPATACEKFVNVPQPGTQIEEEKVFSSNETAISAMRGIYGEMLIMQASPYYTAVLTGLIGDELDYPTNEDEEEFYYHRINCGTNGYISQYWKLAYNYISRANVIFEKCSVSPSLDASVKKQLMAEALFIRAYWYLNLVNLFGDIPLALNSDYKANAELSRTPVSDVYKQIIDDLIIARQQLSITYVKDSNLSIDAERTRPNSACAGALLARAYLYDAKYAEAERAASLVISNPAYKIESIQSAFLRTSQEAIWQFALPTPNAMNINTMEGFWFILTNTPKNDHRTALSKTLMDAFEAGDQRRTYWTGVYIDTASVHPASYYYAYKYKIKNSTDPTEYTMMLRLAELYLIRAEARVHLGRYAEALADINVLRKRAGLFLYTLNNTQISQANLLKLIMKERQVELFTEQGHRWFDLKRSGSCDAVMEALALNNNNFWKPEYKLLPFPKAETLLNPNLQQNPGY
ncbi:RagB/SusD family nutrient uptake outer membrane protein [Chitinophaga filiformis]|uniref:RagB/SusD family nutrient uptake outer membrane protein n=1 Tax=Chitinophaga filiformis TaxID=104663 RepID=A0ABY4HX36_CHIFI|nr:RagB/SusD family nutrient uptake outer membrane protein [Chitinophaga filiformis]UPK67993.1 RagB/SusD family nutrient uptake outer membrane protein [Chitinophaga filiformis]